MIFSKKIIFNAAVVIYCLVNTAFASIILTKSGNDLLIKVDSPVTFTLTYELTSTQLGFIFPGAIGNSGFGGYPIFPDSQTTPNLTGVNLLADDLRLASIGIGGNLLIHYYLSDPVDFLVGDLVTLTTGEFLVPNVFLTPGKTLNYTSATEVVLFNSGGFPISDPTLILNQNTIAVAIPSLNIYGLLGLIFLLMITYLTAYNKNREQVTYS